MKYPVYENKATSIINLTVQSFCVSGACAAITFSSFGRHIDNSGIISLLLIFNLCAFSSQGIFGLFADTVTDKLTAVRLGVILTMIGYAFPASENVTLKIIILGIGCGVFQAAAAAKAFTMNGGGIVAYSFAFAPIYLGTAICALQPFYGFVCAVIGVIVSAGREVDTKDLSAENKVNASDQTIKPKYVALLAGFGLLTAVAFTLLRPIILPEVVTRVKEYLFLGIAIFAGTIAGGYSVKHLGTVITASALLPLTVISSYLKFEKSLLLTAFLIAAVYPVIVMLLVGVMPKRPAFASSIVRTLMGLFMLLSYNGIIPETATKITVFISAIIIVAFSEVIHLIRTYAEKRTLVE